MNSMIIFVVVFIPIGIWKLVHGILSLFPCFLSSAAGKLVYTNTKKNVKGFRGLTIPLLTTYRYDYYVNRKKYTYSSKILDYKSCLSSRVTMVYVKWFPRRAYPNKFHRTDTFCIAAFFLLLGALSLLAILL